MTYIIEAVDIINNLPQKVKSHFKRLKVFMATKSDGILSGDQPRRLGASVRFGALLYVHRQ